MDLTLHLTTSTRAKTLQETCREHRQTLAENNVTLLVSCDKAELFEDAEVLDALASVSSVEFVGSHPVAFNYLCQARTAYEYFCVRLRKRIPMTVRRDAASFLNLETLHLYDDALLSAFDAPNLTSLRIDNVTEPANLSLHLFPKLLVLELTMSKPFDANAFFAQCLRRDGLFRLVLCNCTVGTRPTALAEVFQDALKLQELVVSSSKSGFCESFYQILSRIPCVAFRDEMQNREAAQHLQHLIPADRGIQLMEGVEVFKVEMFKEKWDRMGTFGTWAYYDVLQRSSEWDFRWRSLRKLDLFVISHFFDEDFVTGMPFVEEMVWRAVNWPRLMVKTACILTKARILGFGGGGIGELEMVELETNPHLTRVDLHTPTSSQAAFDVATEFSLARSQ